MESHVGTLWNMRTVNSIGKTAQVTSEINDIGSVSLKLASAGGLGSADSEPEPERPSSTQVGKMTFAKAG